MAIKFKSVLLLLSFMIISCSSSDDSNSSIFSERKVGFEGSVSFEKNHSEFFDFRIFSNNSVRGVFGKSEIDYDNYTLEGLDNAKQFISGRFEDSGEFELIFTDQEKNITVTFIGNTEYDYPCKTCDKKAYIMRGHSTNTNKENASIYGLAYSFDE